MHGTLSQPDSSKPVPASRLPLTLRLALRELLCGRVGFFYRARRFAREPLASGVEPQKLL